MIGSNISIIVHPSHQARHNQYIKNYLETGNSRIIGTGRQVQAIRRDQSLADMYITLIYQDYNEKKFFVGILRDVSHESNLLNKLEIATKLATLGELASNIAHEINNPLAIISGNLEIIRKKASQHICEDDFNQYLCNPLNKSKKSVARIGHIVKSLKKYFKDNHESRKVISLHQAIDDTLEMIYPILKLGTIQLKIDLMANHHKIMANYGQIEQILINLLKNAKEALEEKAHSNPELIITSSNPDNTFIKLTIWDNGPGITPEKIEHVFDTFFSTKSDGIRGLGLSTVRSLVVQHDGKIDCQSKIDEYCEFSILFPLIKES